MAAAGEVVAAGAGAGGGFLQKFQLYETSSMFYMIGRDKTRTMWKVLKIDRLESSELSIHEDPTVFTESECHGLLQRIHEGNKSTGGLKYVTKCYGIVGFIKFLGPYYMLLITKRRKIGTICNHVVYTIAKSEIIRLPSPTMLCNMAYSKDENRYKRLLCAVDLTKDFFFSYSYNIMRSLQKNVREPGTTQGLYDTMFVWNEFLTRGIRNQLKNTNWTVALVYGFFKQSKHSICGKDFRLTLIARRSRHFAGTRYLKRGVNEKGRVANDVETEQIVFEDTPGEIPRQITSVAQNRGSIPLFWSQETSRLNIRPDIILHNKKDPKYEATQLHFDNLVKRYGNPIIILNLIKTHEKKPRESVLRAEFAKAIHNLNKGLSEESRLRFIHWDLNKHSRRKDTSVSATKKDTSVLAALGRVAAHALNLTDIFHCEIALESRSQDASRKQNVGNQLCDGYSRTDDFVSAGNEYEEDGAENVDTHKLETSISGVNCLFKPLLFQKGVLRTNCIDCLDRTNVAQYAYGLAALGRQLHALELMDIPSIGLDAALAIDLMILYERMGDTLALQYGGSAAHNKIFSERRGQWKPATQSQELIRTIQRYYSNAYLDAEKQNAINVFLGHFQPQLGKPALWELNSDQNYNIGRRGHGFADENARSFIKRSLSDGNILRESSTPLSTYNVGENEIQNSALPPRVHQLEDITELSGYGAEIKARESGVSYSRCIPAMSQKHHFPDNSQENFLSGLGPDESNWSNFLDLDWLSSSGNSCEDEASERASLINSPAENTSSENVTDGITDTDTSLSHEVSSIEEREETYVETETSHVAAQSSEILDEFPESFVQWVEKGGTLFYAKFTPDNLIENLCC